MISKSKRVITSVKIPDVLYEDFKVTSVKTKINLQDIVERSIFMYLTDSKFRQTIHEQYNTYYTGSSLINVAKNI
jgi:hypothetical protein